jgi:hypothetical protein
VGTFRICAGRVGEGLVSTGDFMSFEIHRVIFLVMYEYVYTLIKNKWFWDFFFFKAVS